MADNFFKILFEGVGTIIQSTVIGCVVGGGVGGIITIALLNKNKSITHKILSSSGGILGGAVCGAAVGSLGSAVYLDYNSSR